MGLQGLDGEERPGAPRTITDERVEKHRSTAALEQAIKGWLDGWNENPRPFIWVKTADQTLEAVSAFCHRTSDSGH